MVCPPLTVRHWPVTNAPKLLTRSLGGTASAPHPVRLIGPQGDERIRAEEVARRLGTINYEVTCGLLPRVRREYGG